MSNQQVFEGKSAGNDLKSAIDNVLKSIHEKTGGGSCDIKTVRILSIDLEWGGLVPQAVSTTVKATIVDGAKG